MPTGKRPAGTRLTSEPPSLAAAAQAVVETQRAKKGLPFLKNSMSGLLLRRKASQNAPDLQTLPLPRKPGETKYEPIRGTRVHDFSAPRKRVVPTRQPSVPGIEATTQGDLPLRVQNDMNSSGTPDASPEGQLESDPKDCTKLSKEPSQASTRPARKISLDDKPLPADPPVAISSSTDQAEPAHSTSTKSRPISAASLRMRANPSTRTNKSRHISLSDDAVSLSALPKHMKSTSSRFSFDMKGVSEAAMAEKVLEERHRQKELERKANGEPSHRDSRFDDFDEDAFDYDAAMMDDGLEEEIPEVNADYDENDYLEEQAFEEDIPMVGDLIVEEAEEDQNDPDNDQENFAGFVFTRSNPHSSLVSPATPGVLNTPRDAVGRPIGYAYTKDGTPMLGPATSPLPSEDEVPEKKDVGVSPAGLGIQGLEAPPTTQYDPTVFQERRNLPPIEDMEKGQDKGLYYDGGLLEELQLEAGEMQESQFDENLFDLDDVDEFGRPLPGVFQQNLDMSTKAQGHKQRDSDMTSPPSEASGSTAHTSVSVGIHPVGEEDLKDSNLAASVDERPAQLEAQREPVSAAPLPQANDDQAYQMALFEGVQKAAASGWKSRWAEEDEVEDEAEGHSMGERKESQLTQASPSGNYDVTITSPTTASQPSTAGLGGSETVQPYDYDDDNFAFDNDDDFYDEDFIAEANAEALAYDDEGFYGTEFGFYSAPPPARAYDDGSTGSGSIYGGYFGPSGALQRGLSTRNVLREPNLTPITEMSEYSNRNSMLSMGGLPSATLADFRSPHMEDFDYTLGGLQRLRGKTFGGSQISLNSSRDGSPRSERAPLHSERFETTSPMPWDVARSQYAADSPTVTGGFPPQPLFSPPPPPSPGRPQCFPVLEEDTESGSPGGRTLKNTPADSETELSPSGTFGRTAGEESSLSSFDTPSESPAFPGRLGEEERTVLHEGLAFAGRDTAVPVET